jgi:vanillate monooxygenase ferredoxin subunit
LSETLTVTVAECRAEAADIKAFRLVSASGGALPRAEAGAHIDLLLPNGLVRQYSLCNGPEESGFYLIAIKRDEPSRGGSEWIHASLAQGQTVEISAPRNHFPLRADAAKHYLLAGGIGVTPLFAMARSLAKAAAEFEMHYFARSDAHFAFRDALEAPPLKLHTHLYPGLDVAATRAAVAATLARAEPESASHLYVCGPGPFIDMCLEMTAHWPEGRVHFERFSAVPVEREGGDHEFQVELAQTGVTVTVPVGKSIVEALREHKIYIDTDCEEGICGTCMTNVLSGAVDHRDSILTPQEIARGEVMLPCVSRAKGDKIVLDA